MEPLPSFKIPYFIGCNDDWDSYLSNYRDVEIKEVNFDICKDTGFIQLRELMDPNLVYSKYHSEAVGEVWRKHHKKFSEFVLRRMRYGDRVLEIGGSNGNLANLIYNESECSYTIVDPNPNIETISENIRVEKSFFPNISNHAQGSNVIIHSHILEHFYKPIEMLDNIYKLCYPHNEHIFSVPNMWSGLKNKNVNTVNFEHTFFLPEYQLDEMLSKCGFKIIEKEYFGTHSIFYHTRRKDKTEKLEYSNFYERNKKLFNDFVYDNLEFVKYINSQLKHYNQTYIFGAHIFSQFMFSNGLNQNFVDGIIDNSINKHGKRLFGTDMKVYSPDILKGKDDTTLVVVKMGEYTNEVADQIRNMDCRVHVIC